MPRAHDERGSPALCCPFGSGRVVAADSRHAGRLCRALRARTRPVSLSRVEWRASRRDLTACVSRCDEQAPGAGQPQSGAGADGPRLLLQAQRRWALVLPNLLSASGPVVHCVCLGVRFLRKAGESGESGEFGAGLAGSPPTSLSGVRLAPRATELPSADSHNGPAALAASAPLVKAPICVLESLSLFPLQFHAELPTTMVADAAMERQAEATIAVG